MNYEYEYLSSLDTETITPGSEAGDTVVIDNASFHKSKAVQRLIESKGATLLYLPPYSPDLNPIENYWALLKLYVRKYNSSFDTFYHLLDEFMKREQWCSSS